MAFQVVLSYFSALYIFLTCWLSALYAAVTVPGHRVGADTVFTIINVGAVASTIEDANGPSTLEVVASSSTSSLSRSSSAPALVQPNVPHCPWYTTTPEVTVVIDAFRPSRFVEAFALYGARGTNRPPDDGQSIGSSEETVFTGADSFGHGGSAASSTTSVGEGSDKGGVGDTKADESDDKGGVDILEGGGEMVVRSEKEESHGARSYDQVLDYYFVGEAQDKDEAGKVQVDNTEDNKQSYESTKELQALAEEDKTGTSGSVKGGIDGKDTRKNDAEQLKQEDGPNVKDKAELLDNLFKRTDAVVLGAPKEVLSVAEQLSDSSSSLPEAGPDLPMPTTLPAPATEKFLSDLSESERDQSTYLSVSSKIPEALFRACFKLVAMFKRDDGLPVANVEGVPAIVAAPIVPPVRLGFGDSRFVEMFDDVDCMPAVSAQVEQVPLEPRLFVTSPSTDSIPPTPPRPERDAEDLSSIMEFMEDHKCILPPIPEDPAKPNRGVGLSGVSSKKRTGKDARSRLAKPRQVPKGCMRFVRKKKNAKRPVSDRVVGVGRSPKWDTSKRYSTGVDQEDKDEVPEKSTMDNQEYDDEPSELPYTLSQVPEGEESSSDEQDYLFPGHFPSGLPVAISGSGPDFFESLATASDGPGEAEEGTANDEEYIFPGHFPISCGLPVATSGCGPGFFENLATASDGIAKAKQTVAEINAPVDVPAGAPSEPRLIVTSPSNDTIPPSPPRPMRNTRENLSPLMDFIEESECVLPKLPQDLALPDRGVRLSGSCDGIGGDMLTGMITFHPLERSYNRGRKGARKGARKAGPSSVVVDKTGANLDNNKHHPTFPMVPVHELENHKTTLRRSTLNDPPRPSTPTPYSSSSSSSSSFFDDSDEGCADTFGVGQASFYALESLTTPDPAACYDFTHYEGYELDSVFDIADNYGVPKDKIAPWFIRAKDYLENKAVAEAKAAKAEVVATEKGSKKDDKKENSAKDRDEELKVKRKKRKTLDDIDGLPGFETKWYLQAGEPEPEPEVVASVNNASAGGLKVPERF